ncbi:MAG: GyrI-like domain-containing protein [Dehalococcoidales bacterium]|nr:GyrI-like domain-containing protein [Dehalococcoidales bacterium]
MTKIDLKKQLKQLYIPSTAQISIVDVPAMNFVMIDGKGDPNKAREYQDAIEALYAISYTLKFMVKKEQEIDYGVMPLEGLWWTDDMTEFNINKDIWKWTSMIMQPEYVSEGLFNRAMEQVAKKKALSSLSKARFQSFHEGLAAQIMYIGPFAEEGPTVEKIHSYIKDNGYVFDGLTQKHHEVYLSDFRKTAPEKLKTIIRQPIVKK